MLRPGGNDIDACGIDAAVPEDIRELGNVSLDAVKHSREQMPQIVREDLTRVNVRLLAKSFHFPPDVRPADRFAGPRHKDTA